jgi:hypothetical protein
MQQADPLGAGVGRDAEEIDRPWNRCTHGRQQSTAYHVVACTQQVAIPCLCADYVEYGGCGKQPEWKNDHHLVNRMAKKLCAGFHKYLSRMFQKLDSDRFPNDGSES